MCLCMNVCVCVCACVLVKTENILVNVLKNHLESEIWQGIHLICFIYF